jgi:hypothetical protein
MKNLGQGLVPSRLPRHGGRPWTDSVLDPLYRFLRTWPTSTKPPGHITGIQYWRYNTSGTCSIVCVGQMRQVKAYPMNRANIGFNEHAITEYSFQPRIFCQSPTSCSSVSSFSPTPAETSKLY